MKLSNNRKDRAPTGNILPPNKALSAGNGLQLLRLLAKGCLGNPKTTKSIAKSIGCTWRTDSKVLPLNTILTQLIEHREVKLVPTSSLHTYMLVIWYRNLLCVPPTRRQTATRPQPFWSIMVSCLQDTPVQWWNKAWENNQLITDLAEGSITPWDGTLSSNTTWVIENLRLDSPGT